ncbi:hypothetical protein RJG79_04480 [Mycoplasmatota bacterium WC44]
MRRKGIIFFCVSAILIIVGIVWNANILNFTGNNISKLAPDGVEDVATDSYNNLFTGEINSLHNLFVNEFKNSPEAKSKLIDVYNVASSLGEIKKSNLIGYYFNTKANLTGQKSQYHSLVYELELNNRWVLYDIIIAVENNEYKIMNLHFNEVPKSMKSVNEFSLITAKPIHYIMLSLLISVLVFTLYTAAKCVGECKHRKLIWVIFILLGMIKLKFNWTTSEFDFKLLSIYIPTGTILKQSDYSPLFVIVHLPVGAILYWIIKPNRKVNHDSINVDNN